MNNTILHVNGACHPSISKLSVNIPWLNIDYEHAFNAKKVGTRGLSDLPKVTHSDWCCSVWKMLLMILGFNHPPWPRYRSLSSLQLRAPAYLYLSITRYIHITHSNRFFIPSGLSPHRLFHGLLPMLMTHVESQTTLILEVKDSSYDFPGWVLISTFEKPAPQNHNAACEKHSSEWRENPQFLFANLICRINEMQRLMVMEHWGCQVGDFKTWEWKRHFHWNVQA